MTDYIATLEKIRDTGVKKQKQYLFSLLPTQIQDLIAEMTAGDLKLGITDFPYETEGLTYPSPASVVELVRSLRDATGRNDKLSIMQQYVSTHSGAWFVVGLVTNRLSIGMSAKSLGVKKYMCHKAEPYNEKHHKPGNIWFYEQKFDGLRGNIFVDANHNFRALTISGSEILTSGYIIDELSRLIPRGTVGMFDGEIASDDFNTTVSQIKRKEAQGNETAKFHVFDFVPDVQPEEFFNQSRELITAEPLYARKERLEKLVGAGGDVVKPVWYAKTANLNEIIQYGQQVIVDGGEGAIGKLANSGYYRRRHRSWFKIKDVQSVDVPVVGFEEGTGKYEGMLGALKVRLDNGVICSVGSGLNDTDRELMWAAQESYEGRIAEIKYHQETPDGNLRHPRFFRFRDHFVKGVKD